MYRFVQLGCNGTTWGIQPRRMWSGVVRPIVLLVALVLVSGCTTAVPAQQEATVEEAEVSNGRLTDIAEYNLPSPDPIVTPDVSAVIITEGSRANVRSGPGLDSPIVAKANPGDEFQVVGRSEDSEWWQICCVRGPADNEGEATESAWLAEVVLDIDGNTEVVPVVSPILPNDVTSSWQVNWACGSERCDVTECTATVDAQAIDGESQQQWLQIEHNVSWADACADSFGSESANTWVFEVDRYSGRERSGEFVDNFLYNYWLGRQPGPATDVFTLDDGRKVAVWCSGPHELELAETDGWTTVYNGTNCHDVATGELVSLSYTKRWLYSGSFEGQSYERAYFGDFETLEQYLTQTSADLYYIEEKQGNAP